MILLDTQIWLWLALGIDRIRPVQMSAITEARNRGDVISVSIISCWEIAKAVELGRMDLNDGSPDWNLSRWFDDAIANTGVEILDLTLAIAIQATSLPGNFHKDPFDQMIVATARVNNCPLVTADGLIRAYPEVTTIY